MKNAVLNTFLIAAFTFMATGIFSQASATSNNDKMTICHATSSQSNPYVRIVVSENADNGHFNADGTPRSGHQDDILLEGEQDCPNGTQPLQCPEIIGHENLTGFVDIQGNGTITNNSNECNYKVGLASYNMFDANIDNQTLFDSETATINPGQTLQLKIDVPSCAFQIDLFAGDVIESLAGGMRYSSRLIDAKQVVDPPSYCSVTITPTPVPYTPPALTPASAPQPSGGPAGEVLAAATVLPATGTDLPIKIVAQMGLFSIGVVLRRLGR